MAFYFETLTVWQKSFQLVKDIFQDVKKFPKEELYSLVDQIKRSALSIPSNIAE
jgi:four helix bundle protein